MAKEESQTVNPPVIDFHAIIEKLLELVRLLFADQPELAAVVEGVFPTLARLAADEGIDAVTTALDGLAGENSKEHWDWIIHRATHAERMKILQAARQAAVADIIAKIKRDQRRWDGLLAFIRIAAVLLPLLLP
ncbi:MAG TPA: hypothetical protein VM223_08755 [Planctomycetota bacterium]|nr:hypothetical protein [Planctomycetota bacterium]